MKGHVEFIETRKTDLTGYTLIEGFPGMGLVGTISAKYLVEKLEFEEIGFIEAEVFVPIIRIHKGIPINPSRIYINRKLKLAVLISEQIIPQFFTDKMAKAVVDWIKLKKFKRVISLNGIQGGQDKTNKIYGIAANNKSKKLLEQFKIEIIDEGVTTGVTALMLLELKKTELDAISILGNVQIQADYKASADIIQKLDEILGLSLSIEPLLQEAKETEKMLLEHFQKVKDTHDSVKKIEDQMPMYT